MDDEHDYMGECLKILDALAHIDIQKLTERQREVFMMLAQDIPPKEVAEKLFVAHRTVWAHIDNAKLATGAEETRALTVALAINVFQKGLQQLQATEEDHIQQKIASEE